MNPTPQNDTPDRVGHGRAQGQQHVEAQTTDPIVPPAARRFPPADTCAGQLLAELLQGRAVSHRSFHGIAGSWRAAAFVARLRPWGWPIETAMISARNRFETVRYASYVLDESVVIGEREQAYVAECLVVRGGGL